MRAPEPGILFQPMLEFGGEGRRVGIEALARERKRIGARIVQGYYLGTPVALDDLAD